MDVDDDDDFYGNDEEVTEKTEEPAKVEPEPQPPVVKADDNEDLEEGEEEDEGDDDSDIEIITDRQDGSRSGPPGSKSIYNTIPRKEASAAPAKSPVQKKETPAKGTPTAPKASLAGLATSKIEVNAKPVYPPVGKPITQIDIDADLTEHDKPWRRPGTDVSDYFNYGFDEFTWALYASKQESLRTEYNSDKIAKDMSMMMGMGAMPGASGMEGMTPEMQLYMQQMMAGGMDPSQMDTAMFASMAGGAQGAAGQGFGGQGGFGAGGNQAGGYGYDQNMMGDGGSRNRGGNFGRGRGGRRGW